VQQKHFVSLSIFQILAMFRRGIFYFFLSIYLKENLGVTNTEMTLYATLPMVANILTQSTLWGRISDKFQKRRLLIIIGELYAAIGYLAVYFIHKSIGINYGLHAAAYAIIIGFTIIEAGWSSSNLGWTALIADLSKETERSKIMGRLQFIGGIGNILGVTASGYLYFGGEGFWNGNLFFISSGIMVFSIIALFMIPESYADLKKNSTPEQDPNSPTHEEPLETLKKTKPVKWEWKLFIWLLIILAIVNIGGNSINQMLQIHIRLPETFEASDVIVAQLRNTSSAAMIIGGLVIGPLTRKFGDSKMLFVGFMLMFIGTIVLPFAPHISVIFLYMILRGTSGVWIQTTAYSMVTKVIPLEIRGKMMGYYNAAFYLSWGLGGTLITGPVADSIVASNVLILTIYSIIAILVLGFWICIFVNHYLDHKRNKRIYTFFSLLIILALIIFSILKARVIAEWVVHLGNTDAYAYNFTFFIASALIFIGSLSYLLLRPQSFHLFIQYNNPLKEMQEEQN